MKILALADRKPTIDIPSIITQERVDLVISLGDFAREDLLSLATIDSTPKIGVYGNHDSGNYMPELGIWDMHLKIWQFQGVTFGGFQGCVRYKADPYAIMCTQEEANKLLETFPKVDIFISHCPPRGVNDENELAHQGFSALRKYLDTYQPALFLHGHTYPIEDSVVRQYHHTRIEYIWQHRILHI